jgi:hypothetical protein
MVHNECKGTVLIDVTSSYKLLAQVTQNEESNGLRTTEIHVYNTKETCSELVHWCVKCDKEVSLDEVEVSCLNCGTPMSIEVGQVALDTGGIWCEACIQGRCGGEDCIPLSDIYANNSVLLT